MSTISVNLGVQVSGGPPIAIPAHKIEGVESFQQAELSLKRGEKNDNDVTQSIALGKNPIFLVISSDWIDKKSEDKQGWHLTYKIESAEPVLLNSPHIYLREGVLVLDKDWKDNGKTITVTFQKGTVNPPAAADLKEAIANVNIYVGYEIEDSQQP